MGKEGLRDSRQREGRGKEKGGPGGQSTWTSTCGWGHCEQGHMEIPGEDARPAGGARLTLPSYRS